MPIYRWGNSFRGASLPKVTCCISRNSLASHCGWKQSAVPRFCQQTCLGSYASAPTCLLYDHVLASEKWRRGTFHSQSALLRTKCQAQLRSGWWEWWLGTNEIQEGTRSQEAGRRGAGRKAASMAEGTMLQSQYVLIWKFCQMMPSKAHSYRFQEMRYYFFKVT